MFILSLIIGILPLIIVLMTFVLIKSLRNFSTEKFNSTKENISIIIAAKNEEKNLDKLFSSLINIDYPKEKYEIIFVDDNSNDNTFEKANSFREKLPNFIVITADNKKYPAKKGALEIGIQKARFDKILITDADCQISSDWLKCYSQKFSEGFDLVFGNVIYTNHEKSFIASFQQFEHLRSKILYFAAAKKGFPYSANGANFGFSKKVFYELNGYDGIASSLSGDDDLLIQKAIKNKKKVSFINPYFGYVTTESAQSIKDYLNRKARHTSAAYYYRMNIKIILGIWHSINIISAFSIILTEINSIFLFPFLIKILCDIILISEFNRDFGYKFNIFQIILFQILYEIILCINIINGFRFIKRWK